MILCSAAVNSLMWSSGRLLIDVITFSECGNTKFINPSRFPPSRLKATKANSTNSSSFNLSLKQIGWGPVLCVSFGSVADSHLFHPRIIPNGQAYHSITIFPLKCDWERALSCIGNALDEHSFSYFVNANGISFTGIWGTPCKLNLPRPWLCSCRVDI